MGISAIRNKRDELLEQLNVVLRAKSHLEAMWTGDTFPWGIPDAVRDEHRTLCKTEEILNENIKSLGNVEMIEWFGREGWEVIRDNFDGMDINTTVFWVTADDLRHSSYRRVKGSFNVTFGATTNFAHQVVEYEYKDFGFPAVTSWGQSYLQYYRIGYSKDENEIVVARMS